MKLTFLGTRGNIEAESSRHRMHTSLLVAYRGGEVMIDCGESWRGRIGEVRPRAIVVTHAHPDHVGGLKDGVGAPVWAPEEAWEALDERPVPERLRRTVEPQRPFEVEGIAFEAFAVEHSIRAPAVGYRITAGRVTVFYVPDVARIVERAEALAGCRLYIGDGATVDRPLTRRCNDLLLGHAAVRTQLGWCRQSGIGKMVVTHCGSQIVLGEQQDAEALDAKLEKLEAEHEVEVEVAFDGMELVLR